MELPEALICNLIHTLGDRGRRWLDSLPSLLVACERDLQVRIGPPFELSYNYVAPATRADGTEAVLKLSPHGDDFRHELTAIRHFDGHGMVRLVESDETRGIALLERLRPGSMLVEIEDDDRRTEIASDVMLQLRTCLHHSVQLPNARDLFAAFAKHRREHEGGAGPLAREIFDLGEATYDELLRSSDHEVVVHGDLHHYNILSAERAPWLSIDPHGVVAEPAFETGAFLGNPLDRLKTQHPERLLRRRVDIFAERLGLERERIIAWGVAYQTLSAVWSAENEGTGWERAAAVAQIFAKMR